jgi:hypothetical protein
VAGVYQVLQPQLLHADESCLGAAKKGRRSQTNQKQHQV